MTRQKGTLTITVVQAQGVPKTDLLGFGDADPFVVLSIKDGLPVGELPEKAIDVKDDKIQRTQVGEPVNPIWHEAFKIMIDTDVQALFVHLFDADGGRNDEYLGTSVLPLNSMGFEKEWIMDEWTEFKGGKANGTKVHLLVHFQPQTVLEHLGKKFNQQVAAVKSSIYESAVHTAVRMATGVNTKAPLR